MALTLVSPIPGLARPVREHGETVRQSGTRYIYRVHALKNNGVISDYTNPARITVP